MKVRIAKTQLEPWAHKFCGWGLMPDFIEVEGEVVEEIEANGYRYKATNTRIDRVLPPTGEKGCNFCKDFCGYTKDHPQHCQCICHAPKTECSSICRNGDHHECNGKYCSCPCHQKREDTLGPLTPLGEALKTPCPRCDKPWLIHDCPGSYYTAFVNSAREAGFTDDQINFLWETRHLNNQ